MIIKGCKYILIVKMKGSSLLEIDLAAIDQLPAPEAAQPKTWEGRVESLITRAFVSHLYRSEDLLFKVLFDRKYRQDLQLSLLR